MKDFNIVAGVLKQYTGASTRVVLPEGIKAIGAYVFKGLEHVTSVVVPSTCAKIEKGAFENCRSLFAVTLPATLRVIEEGAFAGCRNLHEITLPKELKEIAPHLFDGCVSLTDIHFGNVTRVGAFAFANCQSLREIELPRSVTSIERQPFDRDDHLTKVTMPLPEDIVYDNLLPSYVTDLVISAGAVDNCAFRGSPSLKNVELSDGVQWVGRSAFAYCYELQSVKVSGSLIFIMEYAFDHCSNLAKIDIPVISKLRYIGPFAFRACAIAAFTIPTSVFEAEGCLAETPCLRELTVPRRLVPRKKRCILDGGKLRFFSKRCKCCDVKYRFIKK